MNTARIEFDKQQAAAMYKTYREHRNAYTKVDAVIERVYREIARGRKVIQAYESIRQAGLNEGRRPKLAIIRADAEWCWFAADNDHARFQTAQWMNGGAARNRTVKVPWPGLSLERPPSGKARVPLIPIHHRPKAKLENYHILWEADWQDVPVDPMLLKHMAGDLWLVLAAWDLTAVERAVLR